MSVYAPPGYMTETQFAVLVGKSHSTVRAWRRKSYGPVPRKLGRTVVYSRAEVEAFLGGLAPAEK